MVCFNYIGAILIWPASFQPSSKPFWVKQLFSIQAPKAHLQLLCNVSKRVIQSCSVASSAPIFQNQLSKHKQRKVITSQQLPKVGPDVINRPSDRKVMVSDVRGQRSASLVCVRSPLLIQNKQRDGRGGPGPAVAR